MRTPMLERAYSRLGSRYPIVFLLVELSAAFLITFGTVLLLSVYYEGSTEEFGAVLGIALALTTVSLTYGFFRIRLRLQPIISWIAGDRDDRSTIRAWAAAISLPLDVVRAELLLPALVVVVPSCFAAIAILDLSWVAFFPLLGAGFVGLGYGAILHHLTIEAGMRPILIDINREVTPRTEIAVSAISLRRRLLAALPAINVITGLVVAALTGDSSSSLAFSVFIAIAVATTISMELTILLSRSILSPLADLQRATDQVREGNFEIAVPVTTADEIGDLASSFNQMLAGLRERERIREAFGTYLDEEVADYILSEGFSEQGFEAEVTIIFCDVKDFTSFVAEAEARDVVAELNRMFDVVVPIIAAEGGHVDKFEGDGLMAIFGAPEGFGDHAERGVRAALEIDRRVNRGGEGGAFELGVGINTGMVVAGAVGGGGRLNFSVIGDPVNVAARVESATRQTGDPILITEETRVRLGPGFETRSRGSHELKGIDRPVRLFAPAPDRVGRAAAEPVGA